MHGKAVPDTEKMCRRHRHRDCIEALRHIQCIFTIRKVSFTPSIPKKCVFETDTEPEKRLDPVSTDTVSRYSTALMHGHGAMDISLLGSVQKIRFR